MKHTLLAMSFVLALVAQADHYWKGQGTTADWLDTGNWINGLGNGNTVFGGGKIGDLPEESFATFSSRYTSGQRLWVESNPRKMVTFGLGEGATADAGWTTTHQSDPTWTIGTGRGGDLTILGGTYTLPKGLYISTGGSTSSLTIKGGSISAGGQIQVAKDGNSTSTLTISDGVLSTTSLFQIGLNGTAYLDMTGGTLESSDAFRLATDNVNAKGYATMSAGTINTSGNFVIGNKGDAEFKISGGQVNVRNNKEVLIGGVDANTGSGLLVMDGGAVTNKESWTSIGRKSRGELQLKGGSFYGQKEISVGRYAGATGLVDMAGGELYANSHLIVAEEGDGTFIMGGGNAYVNNQLWIGKTNNSGTFVMTNGTFTTKSYTCVGYGSGSGLFVMNGGTYNQNSEKFIVGQSNNADALGECIISNGVVNVSGRLWVAENNKPGIFTMEGGEFNVTDRIQMSCNNGSAAGKIVLNGGILSYNFIEPGNAGGQGGELALNGGTLKARSNRGDFIPASDKITVTLGARGMVIDTDGHDVAVTATLQNADGLEGNGPIAKKGLGQLEISSALDLARTFTFAIDQGIGKIALTGANTLAEEAKISVVIDPVRPEVGTAYTLLSGLAGLTLDQIEVTGSDDYVYTPELVDGTLSVTLAYSETAAVSAKYVDGEWRYYDAEGNLLEHGKPTDVTNFIFTGAEPASALMAAMEAGLKIVIGGPVTLSSAEPMAIDYTFLKDPTAENARLVIAEGTTVEFAGDCEADIEVNGKLVRKTAWSPKLYFYGTGEIELLGCKMTINTYGSGETYLVGTEFFQGYQGTLTVGEGAELENLTNLHGENADQGPYYFLGEGTLLRMAGGTVTRFGGATNNENIRNVEVVAGTTSIWNNYQSRSGWTGVNMNLTGTITGSGTLRLRCGGRSYRITSDLTEFDGTLITEGEATCFWNGIKGATVISESGSAIFNNNSATPVVVDNASLTLKGNQGVKSNWASGIYTLGANARLTVAENLMVHGISFAEGSSLQIVDDGALGDVKNTYLAFTSDTPVTLTKTVPTLVQPANPRGTWRLFQKEVTTGEGEEAVTKYEVTAEFRPIGLFIILR